jgi:hypothetical protein
MPFSIVPRHRLLSWISECTGDTIWPLDHCQRRGVPPDWIERLSDAFESSFDRDFDTIYFDEHQINHSTDYAMWTWLKSLPSNSA